MQPAASIPPYTQERLQRLKGLRCMVPRKSRADRIWWVTINEVRYVSPNNALVWVSANIHVFGQARWVDLKSCTWKRQKEEPLIMAICRARDGL